MARKTDLIDEVAIVFKALSEPVRLRLLQHLQQGPTCVTGLASALNLGQPNVSRHLRVLMNAGLVGCSRDGSRSNYAVASGMPADLCRFVCEELVRDAQETSARFLAEDGRPAPVFSGEDQPCGAEEQR